MAGRRGRRPAAELHPLERGLRPEKSSLGTFVRRSAGPSDRQRNLQVLFRGVQRTRVLWRRLCSLRVRVLIRSEPGVVGSVRLSAASSPRWGRRSAAGPGSSSICQRIFRPDAARSGVPARRSVLPDLVGGWCLVGRRRTTALPQACRLRVGCRPGAVPVLSPGAHARRGLRPCRVSAPPSCSVRLSGPPPSRNRQVPFGSPSAVSDPHRHLRRRGGVLTSRFS